MTLTKGIVYILLKVGNSNEAFSIYPNCEKLYIMHTRSKHAHELNLFSRGLITAWGICKKEPCTLLYTISTQLFPVFSYHKKRNPDLDFFTCKTKRTYIFFLPQQISKSNNKKTLVLSVFLGKL